MTLPSSAPIDIKALAKNLRAGGRAALVKKNRDLFIDKWCRFALRFLDTLGEKPQTVQALSRPLFGK